MRMKFIINKRKPGKQVAKYVVKWFVKGQSAPVTLCGTDSLFFAVKFIFTGWLYAFKYPTTISKTFLQVLKTKLFTLKN